MVACMQRYADSRHAFATGFHRLLWPASGLRPYLAACCGKCMTPHVPVGPMSSSCSLRCLQPRAALAISSHSCCEVTCSCGRAALLLGAWEPNIVWYSHGTGAGVVLTVAWCYLCTVILKPVTHKNGGFRSTIVHPRGSSSRTDSVEDLAAHET